MTAPAASTPIWRISDRQAELWADRRADDAGALARDLVGARAYIAEQALKIERLAAERAAARNAAFAEGMCNAAFIAESDGAFSAAASIRAAISALTGGAGV